MQETTPGSSDGKALSSWTTTRPQMENTNVLVRGFTRLNVYLYSKPPSKMVKRINRAFLQLNIVLFRESGGRLFGHFGKLNTLLITTTGRRTGKSRTNPLGALYDRGRFMVCAAPGHFDVPGGPQATHPAWYLNLRANPSATVDLGVERFEVTAQELFGEARDRAWRQFTDVFPFIGEFQKRASHQIPVLVLTPNDLNPATL